MASKNDTAGGEEQDFRVTPDDGAGTGSGSKRPGRLMQILIVLAVLLVLYVIWKLITGAPQQAATSPAPAAKEATSSTLTASVPGQQATVAALGVQENQLEKDVAALKQQIAAMPPQQKAQIQQLQDELNQKLNELQQNIASQQDQAVARERNGQGGTTAPTGTGSLPFATAPGAATSGPAFAYQPLFGGSAASPTSTNSDKGILSNLPPVSFPGDTSAPAPQQNPSAQPTDGSKPATQSPAAGTSATALDAAYAAANGQKTATIPGQSYVRVTLLHGVACPVPNSNLVGGSGSAAGALGNDNVPVVMPITGEWHGPNGHIYNIGSANLLGLCTGQETADRNTANVKLERLSYVGPDGVPQDLPVNGYVMDSRDNDMGIACTLESMKGEELADASKAAAIAAVGNVGNQLGQTNQVNPLGGTASVINPGGAVKSAAGSSFAAGANIYAAYWAQKAAQSIDVCAVPSGVPLLIVNIDPIVYATGPKNKAGSSTALIDPPY